MELLVRGQFAKENFCWRSVCRSCGAPAPQKNLDLTKEAIKEKIDAGKGGKDAAWGCSRGGGGSASAFDGASVKSAQWPSAGGGGGGAAPWRREEREQTAVEHCLEALKHAKAAVWPQSVLDVLEQQLADARAARDAAVDPHLRRVRATEAVRNKEKALEIAEAAAQSLERVAVDANAKAEEAVQAVARCQSSLEGARNELHAAFELEGLQVRSEFCAAVSK